MRHGWTTIGLASAFLLGPLAASSTEPPAARLAAELRRLYVDPGGAWERWGHRASPVVLSDGTRVARDAAYRDRAEFLRAARLLLDSPAGDDAPLGAWLLSTAAEDQAPSAVAVLEAALEHEDARAAFEAARALGRIGGPACLGGLAKASQRADSVVVRAAARWAAETITRGRRPGLRPIERDPPALPPAFRRGVSWWMSESGQDDGAGSFGELARLGVQWVSIHTWEPRQRALDVPDFAPATGRFGGPDLSALARSAHAAGLRVLYKPHLEMQGFEATPEDEAALRGGDRAARRRVFERAAREGRLLQGRHNEIEMRTDADWRAWFESYGNYILAHAAKAQAARVDMLCVGRELDRTVLRRAADWRRLIARIRALYPGPLTYSANFDTYRGLEFWDALDFIGISAYFPLSDGRDPSPEELRRGWDRALGPLEDLHRRTGRPVLFTELGYPSVPGAAAAPWRETGGPADVWLQARLYDAAFETIERRPWIEGAFPWLWEGTAKPPFRDPSYSIQGKPAAFVMARWYGVEGGGS